MKRYHFIAIGGAAMHNLALALYKQGHLITGSDDEIFEPSRGRLKKAGLLPESEGWHPEKLDKDLDGVILGMHAKEDNPELKKAQELGLKIYSYPEFLYNHAKDKMRLVIGGSHGKTTTTAMVLHVLNHQKIKSDYMVGAQLKGFETMVSLSEDAEMMVLEGDEYLTSPIDRRPKFHLYKPDAAVITGIAWDHMNVFPTFDNYLEQFREYIRLIEPQGKLIYCNLDADVQQVVGEVQRDDIEYIPYGLPEYKQDENGVSVLYQDKTFPMLVFGKHNLMNMQAARYLCESVGVSTQAFYQAMQSFSGASGRLETLRHSDTTTIFRDFAHAPSKLKATINAVKEKDPNRRLIAVMELHTFSSLNKDFLPHYKDSMNEADTKVVFYSPHTLQLKRLPELSKLEVKEFFGSDDLEVITEVKELQQFLSRQDYRHTNLLLMSSGNFGGLDLEEVK